MACIPSFEALLLGVHQCLVQDSYPPKLAGKIADLGYSREKSREKIAEILDAIKRHLEIAPEAWRDVELNLQEWSDFHRSVQINTWTGLASAKQVVWAMCCYAYAPGLARRLAFWNFPEQFDKGMPGGMFWFLPRINNKTVELPVATVTGWLLDLLGKEAIDASLAKELGNDAVKAADKSESVLKTLRGWHDGQTPRVETIRSYFADSVRLQFDGAFLLSSMASADLASEQAFEEARQFVQKRGMAGATLRREIPMIEELIDRVLLGSGTPDENERFVGLLRDRYQPPSMRTIRQRMCVARMVQDAYIELLEFLCPDVSKFDSDMNRNKVLQLVLEFELIYNLTLHAWKKNEGKRAEEIWFEKNLPPILKEDVFISIRPALRFFAPDMQLAELLARRFAAMASDEPLSDLPLPGMPDLPSLLRSHAERIRDERAEDLRILNLLEELKRISPWRALQKEGSAWVLAQLAHEESLAPKSRQYAIDRLREVARHPMDLLAATCIELHQLLDTPLGRKSTDAQQRVQSLLDTADDMEVTGGWAAPLLSFRAKHLLSQNAIEDALSCFREALTACSDRNYGRLRGEIARDLLATDVMKNGFIPNNQEKYFRNMLEYGMFEMNLGSLDDTRDWAGDYFWDTLYHPYRGVPTLRRSSQS